MRKYIIISLLFFLFAIKSENPKKKQYRICKASCQEDSKNYSSCVADCQWKYCRNVCHEKHADFKESVACKKYYECKINKEKSCDAQSCLDEHHKAKKPCLDECGLIYDMALEKPVKGKENSCSECYCFNEKSSEFLGKAKCSKNDVCQDCNATCKTNFKKIDKKDGVKGICK